MSKTVTAAFFLKTQSVKREVSHGTSTIVFRCRAVQETSSDDPYAVAVALKYTFVYECLHTERTFAVQFVAGCGNVSYATYYRRLSSASQLTSPVASTRWSFGGRASQADETVFLSRVIANCRTVWLNISICEREDIVTVVSFSAVWFCG